MNSVLSTEKCRQVETFPLPKHEAHKLEKQEATNKMCDKQVDHV